MVTAIYSREDMRLAYEGGYARCVWEEISNGRNEEPEFPQFMQKHYPSDTSDMYTVYYKFLGDEGHDSDMLHQSFAAEDLMDAVRVGRELMETKGIFTTYFNVMKNEER